ncbi:hypothetical protein LguiB_001499 [Lonicera macranthoides]
MANLMATSVPLISQNTHLRETLLSSTPLPSTPRCDLTANMVAVKPPLTNPTSTL